jgi:hypothetical protein
MSDHLQITETPNRLTRLILRNMLQMAIFLTLKYGNAMIAKSWQAYSSSITSNAYNCTLTSPSISCHERQTKSSLVYQYPGSGNCVGVQE